MENNEELDERNGNRSRFTLERKLKEAHSIKELSPDQLCWSCPIDIFPFEVTSDLSEIKPSSTLSASLVDNPECRFLLNNQERALKAIQFGIEMKDQGYNGFVTGIKGASALFTLKNTLEKLASTSNVLHTELYDHMFVYNFKNPSCPRFLSMESGFGIEFKKNMEKLVSTLNETLPKIFESEPYQQHKKQLVEQTKQKVMALLKQFELKINRLNFVLVQVQMGPYKKLELFVKLDKSSSGLRSASGLAKGSVEGAISIDELELLVKSKPHILGMTLDEFDKKKKQHAQLTEELNRLLKELRNNENLLENLLQDLEKTTLTPYCSDLIKELLLENCKGHGNFSEEVSQYLEEVLDFIVSNAKRFAPNKEDSGKDKDASDGLLRLLRSEKDGVETGLTELQVNLAVDNSEFKRKNQIPIVVEPFPSYNNVFGFIDGKVVNGIWKSNHMNIRSGSLLRANGGILVMNASDVLNEVGVWKALIRSLKFSHLEIQNYTDSLGFALNLSASSVKPLPIPIDCKIFLVGNEQLYQLLSTYEEDFSSIFKVKISFEHDIKLTRENVVEYARFIKYFTESDHRHQLVEQQKQKQKQPRKSTSFSPSVNDSSVSNQTNQPIPFDRSGVAAIIEYGVRLTEYKNRITTQFSLISDLVKESQYWAMKEKSGVVTRDHVAIAIKEKVNRVNLLEELMMRRIQEGSLMLQFTGRTIGQINGLSIYHLGDHVFGKPSKITAVTGFPCGDKTGVIDIEREAKLSGKAYNKSSMIISAYLRNRYAQFGPIQLSVSLCFEQSYGMIDGDSASLAELYAILSSLSAIPLRQDIAVTGSMNQFGHAQPIGAVNEKVEGFYDACKLKTLSGTQGVLIPLANVENLMLKKEIIEDVKKGMFHLYAIADVDEGLEIITGVKAGQLVFTADGHASYEECTVHNRVQAKLAMFFRKHQDKYAKKKNPNSNDETPSTAEYSSLNPHFRNSIGAFPLVLAPKL